MTTKVLVVGADPALAERPDVVFVDVPFPRELAVQRLQHIGDEHPGMPVLPKPKPLTRDAFVAVLRRAKDAIQ